MSGGAVSYERGAWQFLTNEGQFLMSEAALSDHAAAILEPPRLCLHRLVQHLRLLQGFAFRVSDFGFRVSGFGFRVSCSVFRVSCFEFRVSCFGFRVSGLGFRVSGFGFRVSSFGCTGVLHLQENAPPENPTVDLCLGS